jgi:hypothetical protein
MLVGGDGMLVAQNGWRWLETACWWLEVNVEIQTLSHMEIESHADLFFFYISM